MLAEKLNGDTGNTGTTNITTEFFLPRDFDKFCTGCTACFTKSETLCPHYKKLQPITEAMDEADVIIFASPVYVYHATGAMKAFLDHYGYRWMVHRPDEKMFGKQAVCISTAAGAGTGSTNKDMADSAFFWGCGRIYKLGIGVRATSWKEVDPKIKARTERMVEAIADKIIKRNGGGKVKPTIKTKLFFSVMRMMGGLSESDKVYWQEKGWLGKARPWK